MQAKHLRWGIAAVFALLGGAAVWAYRVHSASSSTPSLLAELSRAKVPRQTGARLSIDLEYRPCRSRPGGELGIPVAECTPARPPRRAADAVARAGVAARRHADPDALHAVAVGDLLWNDTARVAASISRLLSVSLLHQRPANALVDLSAAHLERAGRHQSPRDLLEAVEAAARAREADPQNLAARWNLAYALQALAVDGEAEIAWRDYLAMDRRSPWADEARSHLEAMRTARLAAARDTARSPQVAAYRGWVTELGAWGDSVIAGNAAAARAHLGRAEAVGAALERAGADATLADAVRFIRARGGDPRTLHALARAHADYARGRALHETGNPDAAAPWLRSAASASSPPLRSWASLFHAATQVYSREPEQKQAGERTMRAVAQECDTLRAPALAGRAWWMLGTTLSRAGSVEASLDAYRSSARFFERARETENLGTLVYLAGEVEAKSGNTLAADELTYSAMRILRPYRASRWLHNQLQVAATRAAAAGMTRAALLLHNENVRVARGSPLPLYVVEALFGRAQVLAAAGKPAAALADLDAGRPLLDGLPPTSREWLGADLHTAVARLLLDSDPRRAAVLLDTVVASPASAQSLEREIRARIARADARLRAGQPDSATADLDSVIALVNAERRSSRNPTLRASLADAARGVFDRMLMLQVRAGRPEQALAYLERGREAFAPVGAGTGGALSLPRARRGEVAIDYALIGDTLLAWTVTDAGVRLTLTTPGRERVLRTARGVAAALEAGANEQSVAQDLALLYDWLIRPLQKHLGADGTPLVVVADGEIAAVPFSALRDTPRGPYLVQSREVRFAATLHDAFIPPAPRRVPASVLVVHPGDDAARAAGLELLPHAAAEADSIAALYPAARILSDTAATPGRVMSSLARAEVVHYAGHAVFDDKRPGQSFLALARPRGRGDGRLRAAEVDTLTLPSVRLVVLSACETQRAQDRRSGGFSGLSAALLRARAGGVVGTLWKVDDEITRPLVTEFHRAYRVSGNPASALRTAQRRLLASDDPTLSSPSAWAGFRYSGR